MADVSTLWETFRGDWRFTGFDLLSGNDIVTAVLISVFTDREAQPDDLIPDRSDDPRGWWGDEGVDRIGSRIWLIDRAKQTQETLIRAQHYLEECLQWLVDDGVALRVDVYVEWTRKGTLGAQITVYEPGQATPISIVTSDVFDFATAETSIGGGSLTFEGLPLAFQNLVLRYA